MTEEREMIESRRECEVTLFMECLRMKGVDCLSAFCKLEVYLSKTTDVKRRYLFVNLTKQPITGGLVMHKEATAGR